MNQKIISFALPDERIIDDLGGTCAVARHLGVGPRVVSNWRKRGISAPGRPKIAALATLKNYILPEEFLDRSTPRGRKKAP